MDGTKNDLPPSFAGANKQLFSARDEGRASDDLTAHFNLICECFEDERNELRGLNIISDKDSLITVSGMGVRIRIEPSLTINEQNHLQPQLSVTKESNYEIGKVKPLARLNLNERSVAYIEVEGEEFTFDFGLMEGFHFRRPPVIEDFLSLVVTLALKEN